MNRRSVSIYLIVIGLLLLSILGWYAYSLLIQPEPASTDFDGSSVYADMQSQVSHGPRFPRPEGQTKTREWIHEELIAPELPLETQPEPAFTYFDGSRSYADVQTQVSFGPRIPGSEGHAKIREWMRAELESAGWQVEIQESERLGNPVVNLVARRSEESPQIILGAHYDTRIFADNDPKIENYTLPVPGANDGASGVAVLLELARSLPKDTVNVWLVFFDAEDNGRIEGWDWILGSREFVENNPVNPRAVVIVDMIGDADLNIYKERNSDSAVTDEIWAIASELGFGGQFINEYKYSMLDDHTPFLEVGIPAVDIIDFDYPYWHTTQDTPDKVSAESLAAVGQTLWTWIVSQSK